tara:strand:+ start:266 stop:487 length:222 start_codon:yes stop_codon:yes gene_type:complete
MEKHTPYDTGKVKIGLLYTQPPPESTPESEWIQGVLLGDKQGWSEDTAACVQSLVAIATVIIGILLLGGFRNA